MNIKTITILALSTILFACGGSNAVDNDNSIVKEETKAEAIAPAPVQTAEASDPMSDKGVGPITSVTIGDIDQTMVDKGKEVFKAKCTACHKIGKRFVGPALKGVTKKQSPEWIMNMILNPEKMVAENETAKKLLQEYNAPMANQGLTQEEARAVLEMLRTKN